MIIELGVEVGFEAELVLTVLMMTVELEMETGFEVELVLMVLLLLLLLL